MLSGNLAGLGLPVIFNLLLWTLFFSVWLLIFLNNGSNNLNCCYGVYFRLGVPILELGWPKHFKSMASLSEVFHNNFLLSTFTFINLVIFFAKVLHFFRCLRIFPNSMHPSTPLLLLLFLFLSFKPSTTCSHKHSNSTTGLTAAVSSRVHLEYQSVERLIWKKRNKCLQVFWSDVSLESSPHSARPMMMHWSETIIYLHTHKVLCNILATQR